MAVAGGRHAPSALARRGASLRRATAARGRPVAMADVQTAESGVSASLGYSAADITVLEGLEPVRKRPGMYIGSTGPAGLHHLVYEVVDNSVDEALAGHCTIIRVFLEPDGSVAVEDDGRGIPCGTHAKTGRSALETVMTVLHAGGKFGDNGYSVSGGLHGVGISVVNALSEHCSVEVRRERFEHRMAFARGLPASELERSPLIVSAPASESGGGAIGVGSWRQRESGTRVRFLADSTIFKGGVSYDAETLVRRFDQLAYLNAGLVIELFDLRPAAARARASARTRAEADVGDGGEEAEAAEGAAAGAEPDGAVVVDEVPSARWADAGLAAAHADGSALPAGARTWRFEHAGGIEEMVADLSGGRKLAAELAGVDAATEGAEGATAAPKGVGARQSGAPADGAPALLSPSPIMIRGERRGVSIEIALQWAQSSYSERLLAFANGIHTPAGGSHVDGLKVAAAGLCPPRRAPPAPPSRRPLALLGASAALTRASPASRRRSPCPRAHAPSAQQAALTRVVNAALKRAATASSGAKGGAAGGKGGRAGSAAAQGAEGGGAAALPKIKGAKDVGGSLSGE